MTTPSKINRYSVRILNWNSHYTSHKHFGWNVNIIQRPYWILTVELNVISSKINVRNLLTREAYFVKFFFFKKQGKMSIKDIRH